MARSDAMTSSTSSSTSPAARSSATTVGILGGGQLGRMLALAGAPLGLRFRLFDPARDACGGQVAPLFVGDFNDLEAVERFALGGEDGPCDLVTYEFENVPVRTAAHLAGRVPVYPPPGALETAQDRLHERRLFERLGIPTPGYRVIDSLEDLRRAAAEEPLPALLKTRRLGYDGKGQCLVPSAEKCEAAWEAIGRAPALLDRFVAFEREVSVIAVRGRPAGGEPAEVRFYPVTENVHRGGILRLSRAPSPHVSEDVQRQAEDAARKVVEALDYVGVLAVEFFLVRRADGGAELLANEIAPRVHNSGHWTIEGAATSQFENHLRAVCGLPLGPTEAVGHAAMVNLIGEVPRAAGVLGLEGAHLHDYGKEPRAGRKVGHVTLVGWTREEVDGMLERFTRVVG